MRRIKRLTIVVPGESVGEFVGDKSIENLDIRERASHW